MNNPAGDWGLWACLVLTETCPALHRLCNSTFLFCCHIIILWLKSEKKNPLEKIATNPAKTNTGLKRQEGVHWEDSNSFQHVCIASSLT